jgi:hypothetical protein
LAAGIGLIVLKRFSPLAISSPTLGDGLSAYGGEWFEKAVSTTIAGHP